MPDGFYERDILADLLRRLRRAERVDDVDRNHVVAEVESVGPSELNAVRGFLRQAIAHLLKPHASPDANRFTLDHLLTEDIETLFARLPSQA